MCEWTGCEGAQGVNVEPRPQLLQSEPLLPATSASENQRFDFASDQQLSELSKGLIPANTSKSTKWAIKTFELWSEARNKSQPQDPVPAHLLTCLLTLSKMTLWTIACIHALPPVEIYNLSTSTLVVAKQ